MVYDGTATIRENSVRTKGVRPMIVQLQKQRSKILEKLLDARSPDFDKLQSKVDAVFEKGRQEGLLDMDIGSMIRTELKNHYSDRTIQHNLLCIRSQKLTVCISKLCIDSWFDSKWGKSSLIIIQYTRPVFNNQTDCMLPGKWRENISNDI